MKKTVEIEYVGIEDVQDIMDDAYALMKCGRYVGFEMSNLSSPKISVQVWLGGWEVGKNMDYGFEFSMSDDAKDVEEMNRCQFVLRSLLEEEE